MKITPLADDLLFGRCTTQNEVIAVMLYLRLMDSHPAFDPSPGVMDHVVDEVNFFLVKFRYLKVGREEED